MAASSPSHHLTHTEPYTAIPDVPNLKVLLAKDNADPVIRPCKHPYRQPFGHDRLV